MLACEDAYLGMLSELVAHCLLVGPSIDHAIEAAVGHVIAAQGWMAGHEPVTEERGGVSVHRALYHWRLFGLLHEQRPRWDGASQVEQGVAALTPAGRAAARILLRALATAPGRRSDLGLG